MKSKQKRSSTNISRAIKDNSGKIILTTIIGLVLSALITFVLIKPTYSSTADIVVNREQDSVENSQQLTSEGNEILLNTYQSLINKPVVLDPVINDLDLNQSVDELADKITIDNESDSLILSINVEDNSPYQAADIANAVVNQFSNQATDILHVQKVSVVTEAKPNETPSSPHIAVNLVVGTVIGALVGFLWVLLHSVFDRTIHSQEIIKEIGWTPLGAVSQMSRDDVKDTRFKKTLSGETVNRRRRV